MALQWFKQPDGTMLLWDPDKGGAPLSAEPEAGARGMPGTDTSDIARQILEDKQGTMAASPLESLITKDTPDVPPATGDGQIDFNSLINALFQQTGDLEGGQSVGTTEEVSPVEPAKGEEIKRPGLGKKVEAYPGGEAFVQGMIKRGWTPDEAAGAAGNVHVESGFKPGIKSSVPTEQSFGFLQWNKDRLQGLKNMAAAKKMDWRDPEAQMDWINMERTGESVKYGGTNESSAYKKAFSGGGDPATIAERFGRYVERPKDLSQSVAQRRGAATQYATLVSKLKDTELASVGAPREPTPSPKTAAVLMSNVPFSDQTMDEEMFSSIVGGTSWA